MDPQKGGLQIFLYEEGGLQIFLGMYLGLKSMSEGISVKQILKIFGASRPKILNLSYKKTAKNEDSKKKMKNI